MPHFQQHTYTTVTEQRGVKRLWLQGLRLRQCGFDKGERYRVDYDMDSGLLHLVADKNGDRVVSGRKRGNDVDPIVDVCNASVVAFAGDVTRVRADFIAGRITFSISHLERNRIERETRFRRELAEGTLTEGTVCSGISMATDALHEGLRSMGVKSSVSWVVDRERRYLEVAARNSQAVTDATQLFEASLEELEPELLSPVSILQASLPCTGHSPAGKTKNKIKLAEEHKTDATAVFGFMNVIQAVSPAICVSENVRQARNSASYIMIKSMLELLDYTVNEIDLGPEQSGSIESRRRYWFVAVSKGLSQVDLSTVSCFQPSYRNIGELLEPLADDHPSWSENRYLKAKQKRDAAEGKGFAKRSLLTQESPSMGVAPRTYQKRQSSSPMLTRPDGKERLFTPIELCRAHSAPESLIEGLVDAVAYEGLGQAIDYRQGIGIGMCIARDCCSAQSPTNLTVLAAKSSHTTEGHDEDQLSLFG